MSNFLTEYDSPELTAARNTFCAAKLALIAAQDEYGEITAIGDWSQKDVARARIDVAGRELAVAKSALLKLRIESLSTRISTAENHLLMLRHDRNQSENELRLLPVAPYAQFQEAVCA